MVKRSTFALLVLVLAAGMLLTGHEAAAEEPWAEIEGESFDFIVGYDAGGSHDITARHMAEGLADLGIEVDVTNMPGGDATEAGYHVATSDPEENIIFWAHPPAQLFDPATRDVGYSFEDFDPVATMGSPTFVFAALVDQPFATYEELVEHIEENPGQTVVGGQAMNHPMHYAFEMLLPSDELDYSYVNLGGGADVQANLAGGHVQAGHLSLAAALPLYEDDELEILVHTSEMTETVEAIPEVPQMREVGVDYAEPHSLSALAPEGIDEGTREALNAAIREVIESEEFQEDMQEMGVVAVPHTIEETEAYFDELVEDVLPDYEAWLEEQQ